MSEYRPIVRHPLAIAWDEWLASDEGKKASDPSTLTRTLSARSYLENRLQRSFNAGASAAQSTLAKAVLDKIESAIDSDGDYRDDPLAMVRDLFTKLGYMTLK